MTFRVRIQVMKEVDPKLYRISIRMLMVGAFMMWPCYLLGSLWGAAFYGLVSLLLGFALWVLWLAAGNDSEDHPEALHELLETLVEQDSLPPTIEHDLARYLDLYDQTGVFPKAFRNDVAFGVMRAERARQRGRTPAAVSATAVVDGLRLTPERKAVMSRLVMKLKQRLITPELHHV